LIRLTENRNGRCHEPRIVAFRRGPGSGKIVGQAHRLPKKLHGNRERLPYRKRP
jgi:hypothetical protein